MGKFFGPLNLAVFRLDQVLPNFELNVRQAAPFAMRRNGIVLVAGKRVGFIVTYTKPAVFLKRFQQRSTKPRILVIKDTDVPRAGYAEINRRTAVHGDIDFFCSASCARVENSAHRVVVETKNFPFPSVGLLVIDVDISRDLGVFAETGDEFF